MNTRGKKNRLLRIALYCVFGALLSMSAIGSSCAEDRSILGGAAGAKKEPITVTGDKVEYFHDKKKVIATKNVVITHKDVKLTCKKVTVYLDTREAIAEGSVRITQPGTLLTGDRINYNFDTKKGTWINSSLASPPWYGKSKTIEKRSETEIALQKGYVTTCDLKNPHYRVQAKEIKIFLEDKIVAKHIVFFVGDMPILYLPYYVHQLDAKKPQVSVIAGRDKAWGYYALTAWRYFFSEKAKGDVRIDYRHKKGFAEGVDHYYKSEALGNGSAKVYFINENDVTAFEKSGEAKKRWRAQWRHRWDMGYNTVNIIEFNKLSDRDIIKDFLYREFEEEGEPDNFISSVTTYPDYTMSVLARKRMDSFFTVVERLPEVKIDIKEHKIGNTPFYYKSDMAGAYLNKTFEAAIDKDFNAIRVDSFDRISYVTRILGFLNTTPYVNWRKTYYSRNKWGDTNKLRNIFGTGVKNSIKFYKVFDVMTEIWGIKINKLRHIITPTVDFFHTHRPSIASSNLPQFDEVDAFGAGNGMQLSLENKLQTKEFTDGRARTIDLATFIVSTDYLFRLRKKQLAYKSQKFSSLAFRLELQPYPWLFILSQMQVNTKNKTVESANTDFTASQGDSWSLGIGHRYESAGDTETNLVTAELMYKFNSKWQARIYERIDALNGKMEEQEYTIYRDLHCWIAEVTYNIKGSITEPSDQTLWVVFRLKAFPDLPLGFRRTYSRSRPGAYGSSTSY